MEPTEYSKASLLLDFFSVGGISTSVLTVVAGCVVFTPFL